MIQLDGNSERFLVFGAPHFTQAEITDVIDCLQSGWISTGPKVELFERRFKQYKGSTYCAAVNSCTAALHLALIASGIRPGDEVITTPLTFCATVNAIIHSGATPVLADIDPVSMNIDPVRIEEKITKRTRAIIPVHFAGRSCNMDALMDLAAKYNLKVIEDCAHAIETEYMGKKAGTFGDFGCFSFYATKNVVTGEGGMVIAKKQEDIDGVKTLGLHGMSKDAWKRFSDEGYKHYQVVDVGFKYNMMDLQAAIGIHQLEKVEENWLRREAIWNRYNHDLAHLPLELPSSIEPNTRHAYHLYTVLIDKETAGINRDDFLTAMTKKKIGVGVHYLSIPEHPYYQKTYGWKPEDYPSALRVGRQTVSLPLTPNLSDEDVDRVIQSVHQILTKN